MSGAAAFDNAAPPNPYVIPKESGALAAVRYQRLFFAEFHFQGLGDKFRQLALYPLTVRFASLHGNDEIVRVTDVFDTFDRLGGVGRFQHQLAFLTIFRKQTLFFRSFRVANVTGEFPNFVAQQPILRRDGFFAPGVKVRFQLQRELVQLMQIDIGKNRRRDAALRTAAVRLVAFPIL